MSSLERLTALRAVLTKRGLDGFLVPRADMFQGEEVAPCDERLAWLTGFTGSAGYALITLDKAYMFTDGRYTLQVQDQCPTDLFEHLSLIDTPPHSFIDQSFGLIAYDPWLLTKRQVRQYSKAKLCPVDTNPVDEIWQDRPASSTGRIWAHPLSLAGQSSADKQADVVQLLKAQSASAFVFTLPDSIAWLLNIRGSDLSNTPVVRSFLVLKADGSCDWYVDTTKVPQDARQPNMRLCQPEAFAGDLAKLQDTVLIDPATAPAALFNLVGQSAHQADPVIFPKARKNTAELAGIRRAHKRDAVAVTSFIAQIKQSVSAGETITEMQAVDLLRAEREKLDGFIGNSFDTISGAGSNGAIVHYRVTNESDRPLQQNQMYLVDSGGQYVDGTTDITRSIFFGTPSDEIRANYTRVLKGHIALAQAKFPKGTTGAALDTLARQHLWEAGLDYDHGTGHGVGACLNVHEGPARIAKPNAGSLVPLELGMFLSNEPGYYKAGAYGIRLENLIVVVACPELSLGMGGEREFYQFETVSFVRFEDNLIDQAMLTDSEKAWLDAYHKQCDEVLED